MVFEIEALSNVKTRLVRNNSVGMCCHYTRMIKRHSLSAVWKQVFIYTMAHSNCQQVGVEKEIHTRKSNLIEGLIRPRCTFCIRISWLDNHMVYRNCLEPLWRCCSFVDVELVSVRLNATFIYRIFISTPKEFSI